MNNDNLDKAVYRLLEHVLGTGADQDGLKQIADVLLGHSERTTAVVEIYDLWLVLGSLPTDGTFPTYPLLVRAAHRDMAPAVFTTDTVARMFRGDYYGTNEPLENVPQTGCVWNISQFGKLTLFQRTKPGWARCQVERAGWPVLAYGSAKYDMGAALLGVVLAHMEFA